MMQQVSELDFNAVQRGDAEMEQKMNRIIRACCELGARNPIVSLHDQVGETLRNVNGDVEKLCAAELELCNPKP
jgi:phosphoribosylformylglycinamidine synthase